MHIQDCFAANILSLTNFIGCFGELCQSTAHLGVPTAAADLPLEDPEANTFHLTLFMSIRRVLTLSSAPKAKPDPTQTH